MSVQNSVWGPPMWRSLHTLAEKLGRQTKPLLEVDEVRCWVQMLRALGGAMPCALCRDHYQAGRKRNPIEDFMPLRKTALREAARKWLWALHEEVNRGRNINGPPLDQMEAMYAGRGALEIRADLDIIARMAKEAMPLRVLSGEQYRAFREKMVLLQRTVGCYSS